MFYVKILVNMTLFIIYTKIMKNVSMNFVVEWLKFWKNFEENVFFLFNQRSVFTISKFLDIIELCSKPYFQML